MPPRLAREQSHSSHRFWSAEWLKFEPAHSGQWPFMHLLLKNVVHLHLWPRPRSHTTSSLFPPKISWNFWSDYWSWHGSISSKLAGIVWWPCCRSATSTLGTTTTCSPSAYIKVLKLECWAPIYRSIMAQLDVELPSTTIVQPSILPIKLMVMADDGRLHVALAARASERLHRKWGCQCEIAPWQMAEAVSANCTCRKWWCIMLLQF